MASKWVAIALLAAGLAMLGSRAYLAIHSADPPAARGHFSYLGVYESAEVTSYGPITRFGQMAGRSPNIVLCYYNLGEEFPAALVNRIGANGAIPFAQISPAHASMAAIAAGKYDSTLRSYARAVRAYGHPLIIGFAAEMNGLWYRWGWQHTSPLTWIAAWRHIVDVFRATGSDNVIWLWTVNRYSRATGPVAEWWPGASYVTWVGIDGYYFLPYDNFANTFGRTIHDIRQFTRKPILLSEVGIGQVAGQARMMPDLFAGILRNHLLGLVWFDVTQHQGIDHQDWRLEGHLAAIAAFRKGVASMRAGTRAVASPPALSASAPTGG